MTPERAEEITADLLTASLGAITSALAGEEELPGLADRILDQLSDDDARCVLAAMTGLASVLLHKVSQQTGDPPEHIILALRSVGDQKGHHG